MWKFERFRAHKVRAGRFVEADPSLFMDWQRGMIGVLGAE
jgi:hypothetical protein